MFEKLNIMILNSYAYYIIAINNIEGYEIASSLIIQGDFIEKEIIPNSIKRPRSWKVFTMVCVTQDF